MAVNLVKKGEKVDLTKGKPSINKIKVQLGWDENQYDGGYDFDLDASVFLLGANGKVIADTDFIFYGNLVHQSGSVQHMGDDLTGFDGEEIHIDLSKVPNPIERICFTVTIYDFDVRKQNFGQVSNAYISVLDDMDGQELVRYDLNEDFSVESAVVVAELYRSGSEWKFHAVGSGFQGGLRALCLNYGVNV